MATFPPLPLAVSDPITRAEQAAFRSKPHAGPRSGERGAGVFQMHAMAHGLLAVLLALPLQSDDPDPKHARIACISPTGASVAYKLRERAKQVRCERILHRQASLELEPLNAKHWCELGRLVMKERAVASALRARHDKSHADTSEEASDLTMLPEPAQCFRNALVIDRDSFDANCQLGLILAAEAKALLKDDVLRAGKARDAMVYLGHASRHMSLRADTPLPKRRSSASPGGFASPVRRGGRAAIGRASRDESESTPALAACVALRSRLDRLLIARCRRAAAVTGALTLSLSRFLSLSPLALSLSLHPAASPPWSVRRRSFSRARKENGEFAAAIIVQLTLAELLFDVQPTLGGHNVAVRQAKAVCKAVIRMCDSELGARDNAHHSTRARAQLLYARCILRCAAQGDTIGDARRMLLCAAASASGIPATLDCPPKISSIVLAHHQGACNIGRGFVFAPIGVHCVARGHNRASNSSSIACRFLLGDLIISGEVARRSKEQRVLPAERRSRTATLESSAFNPFEWSLTDDDDDVDDDGALNIGADATRGAQGAAPPIPRAELALWLLQSGVDDLSVDADAVQSMPPLTQNERAQLAHSMLLIAHHRTDSAFFRRCVCDMRGLPAQARAQRLRLAGVGASRERDSSDATHAEEPAVCFPGDLIQHTIADAVGALAQAAANAQSVRRAAECATLVAANAAYAAHASALSAEGFAALAATTFNVASAVLSHASGAASASVEETDGGGESGTLVRLLVDLYGGEAVDAGGGASRGATRTTISTLAWQDLMRLAEDFSLPSLAFALVTCHRASFTRAVGGDAAFAHLVDIIPVRRSPRAWRKHARARPSSVRAPP